MAKGLILIAIAVMLLTAFSGCIEEEEEIPTTTVPEEKVTLPIKDEIRTTTEGKIVKYQETLVYSPQDFSLILESEEEFKSQLMQKFKNEIIGAEAENCEVSLSESEKTATLKCDIRGASYGTNSYSMHFLLGNWKFDLYQFNRYEKKLVYEGKIDGIPTTVVFEFPYSLSHCHEHVWPR